MFMQHMQDLNNGDPQNSQKPIEKIRDKRVFINFYDFNVIFV